MYGPHTQMYGGPGKTRGNEPGNVRSGRGGAELREMQL